MRGLRRVNRKIIHISRCNYQIYNSCKDNFLQDFKNHYDFLIVGGGLMGSMIAFMLTSRVDTKTGVKVANEPDNIKSYFISTAGALVVVVV